MKTKKVLYTVSNIFSHHIAHTFLPQSFDFHHFTTHIYSSHYTPLSPLPYAALNCTSLHCTSLHFTSLHFYTLLDDFHFTSLHFTSLHFTSLPFTTLFNDFPHTLLFFFTPRKEFFLIERCGPQYQSGLQKERPTTLSWLLICTQCFDELNLGISLLFTFFHSALGAVVSMFLSEHKEGQLFPRLPRQQTCLNFKLNGRKCRKKRCNV